MWAFVGFVDGLAAEVAYEVVACEGALSEAAVGAVACAVFGVGHWCSGVWVLVLVLVG